jgi:hypothetical protein
METQRNNSKCRYLKILKIMETQRNNSKCRYL